MVSSDDEEEVVPESVTNYHFVDENEAPVSFSVLPLRFDESERPEAGKKQVFLHGTTDGGLQKVFKQVTAWKTRLGHEDERPEFFVFSKDKKWIKLLKPRKVYEQCIRKILITVQLLHFLKKNPEAPGKNLWDHLRKIFSSYEDRPSYDDLRDHIPVMKLFLERDEILAKCQLLPMFLEDVPMKKTFGEENDSDAKKSFIVYDDADEDMGDDGGNESEDESDCFDSVCAICDNGGELLCCEGRCLRSFHATKKAGEDSDCKSLGFTKSQVEEIQNFLCKNCHYSQHQCFICGKLGSADKSAGAKPEVYACSNATCGHFYHLECVSQLLFPGNETEAAGLQERIREGETFVCPVHTCVVCKQTEDKKVKELQFAMCRRCPKSYHRKCLPRKIAFEDIEEEDIIQRAWDDLLPNRILIYCLKHKIDEDLGTPIRNHIIFPEIPDKKNSMDGQKSKVKVLVKKNRQVSDDLPHDRTSVKPMKVAEKLTSTEGNRSFVKSGRNIAEQVLDSQKKLKTLKEDVESEIKGADGGSILADAKRTSVDKAKSGVKMYNSSFPVIDAVIEKKIIALMGKASSSVTLEDVIKKRYMPSTHAYSARHNDKNLTHGKVEVSVEAVRTALKKLDSGGSVKDAKAVCEPDIVKQISKWNNKLKVYLAPFLHGMRYTSFGRHFTKVDKLNEIVNKLQWYVQSGDTIVDFCCGANDFSQLMKEKLEAAGKKCSYKNYDVIQPKNDFNFEKRDWMKVHPTELPTGSQLIMGLNPPFGVKAGLANQFINKALTFKPKLLILIVPQETERLDQKKPPYDLIWEDNERLSGKSFYLPGSVDVNDKQMDQWNLKPPPLYLWSRQDWTAKHKAIALKHGHMSKDHQKSPQTEVETQRDRIADAQKTSTAASEEIRRDEKHKMAENSINRKSPENHKTKSRKKKKAKRKRQEASETREVRARESSDMSISPQHSRETTNQSMSHVPSEASDSPKQRASGYGSRVEFGSVSEVGRSAPSIDEVDDIAKRYAAPSIRDGMFGSSSNNWTGGGIDNHDYGMRSSEDRFATYSAAEPYGRSPYMDGYSRSSDIDTRMPQARLYGMQGLEDLSQRNRFSLGVSEPGMGLAGRLPSSTYGLSSAMSGSSAMQRYAPRLDETNYSMPGSVGLGASSFPGGRTGGFDMPGVRRDMPPPDSLSFTPGSHHPFSGQGSGGWIDD